MLAGGEREVRELLICALLFGEAENERKAKRIAESYRDCPYVNLLATKGTQLFAMFVLPERQRWWIEYVEKKPKETFGLEKARVTFVDDVQNPRQLKMRLPRKPLHIAPCGASCGSDRVYQTGKCLGCPATIFYRSGHNTRT